MHRHVAAITDLTDPALLAFPKLCQRKVDGIRVKVEVDAQPNGNMRVRFFSKMGQRLRSLDHLCPEIASYAARIGLKHGFVDCEGTTGGTVEEANAILRDEPCRDAKLYAFDLYDASHPDTRQTDRLVRLGGGYRGLSGRLIPLPFETVEDADHLRAFYRANIDRGEEGVVVREPSATYGSTNAVLRWKRHLTLDLPIVGVVRSLTQAGTIACLVCMDGGDEVKVGTGFTPDERRLFWEMRAAVIGQIAEVKVLGRTSGGKLRSASYVRLRPDKLATASE